MIAETLPGVRFDVRTPALAWILLTLAADPEELVITSGSDSQHAPHSAHYSGEAIDVRVHDLPEGPERRVRAARLAAALGPDFLVLLEPDDIPGSPAAPHIHCQLRRSNSFGSIELGEIVVARWLTILRTAPPGAVS